MEKVTAAFVLEILGRPKENVEEALETLTVKIGSEKGIKIIEKTMHDAIPLENSNGLFTSFAELELEFESLNLLFGSIFAYMPANVEIIKPEKLTLTNTDLSDLTGKLTGRLHDYDAITKKAMTEREMLVHKLKEVAPHLFKQPEPAQEAKQEDKKPRSVKKKKEKAKIN